MTDCGSIDSHRRDLRTSPGVYMRRPVLEIRLDGDAPSGNCDRLRKFLLDHLESLSPIGGTGSAPSLPKFDLYPQDYLAFAENELNSFALNADDPGYLINCVTHLKRAADCQLDMFLHAFNLYRVFRNRNLKFDKKLDFLESAAVFSSRSLRRLNAVRNRIEHDFASPKVDDIEAYYDVVTSMVAVLQRVIASSIFFEQDFAISGPNGKEVGSFSIEYDFKKVRINASWRILGERQEVYSKVDGSIGEFAFFSVPGFCWVLWNLSRAPASLQPGWPLRISGRAGFLRLRLRVYWMGSRQKAGGLTVTKLRATGPNRIYGLFFRTSTTVYTRQPPAPGRASGGPHESYSDSRPLSWKTDSEGCG